MATVKINKVDDEVKKENTSSCKRECKCSKKEESCSENSAFVAPVFTDEYGRININKDFAKEFPDLTQKLLDNEISRNNIRPQVITRNYSKPQNPYKSPNDLIDEIIGILR